MSPLMCGMLIMQILGIPQSRFKVMSYTAKYGIDIVVLAAIESRYKTSAVSTAGAVGVMQLTEPAVIDVKANLKLLPKECLIINERYSKSVIRENILLGYCYLELLKHQHKDLILSVGAYNGGSGIVSKLNKHRAINHETANYIIKFIMLRRYCE